jgi:hypothetical protein
MRITKSTRAEVRLLFEHYHLRFPGDGAEMVSMLDKELKWVGRERLQQAAELLTKRKLWGGDKIRFSGKHVHHYNNKAQPPFDIQTVMHIAFYDRESRYRVATLTAYADFQKDDDSSARGVALYFLHELDESLAEELSRTDADFLAILRALTETLSDRLE